MNIETSLNDPQPANSEVVVNRYRASTSRARARIDAMTEGVVAGYATLARPARHRLGLLCAWAAVSLHVALPTAAIAQHKPHAQSSAAFAKFEEAINQVHVDEQNLAHRTADDLRRSHPQSGYAEIIEAEYESTFVLDDRGDPREVFDRIIKSTSKVINGHRRFAHAYVARARAQYKAGKLELADSDLQVAIKLAPGLASPHYVLGMINTARNRQREAIRNYETFIALAADPRRQANAHDAIGQLLERAAYTYCVPPADLVADARTEYEKAVAKQPEHDWRRIRLALTLVGVARDFPAAEAVAREVLARSGEHSEARLILAAALYQPLNQIDIRASGEVVVARVEEIGATTRVTLEQAAASRWLGGFAQERLRWLSAKADWYRKKSAGEAAPMPAAPPCYRYP